MISAGAFIAGLIDKEATLPKAAFIGFGFWLTACVLLVVVYFVKNKGNRNDRI